MQQRLADSEQRCDMLSRLNENLADDLGFSLDELDALKRTVIDSHSLVVPTYQQSAKVTSQDGDDLVIPSFLRVMQAEQILLDNFAYEGGDKQLKMPITMRRFDESSEADVEPENSIP